MTSLFRMTRVLIASSGLRLYTRSASLFMVGALLGGFASAETATYDSIVIGQNDPAVDAIAVQAAVDGGGRVLLSGTFNFGEAVGEPYQFVQNPETEWDYPNGPSHVPANGSLENSRNADFWASPPQTVFVTSDVEIHGDGTTEIIGGYRTFTVGYRPLPAKELAYDPNTDDGQLGPTTATTGDYPITPVRVTIANIRFVRSLNCSIWLAATRDETRIVDNEFSDNKTLIERFWFGRLRGNAIYTQGGVAAINLFTYADTSVSDMQGVLPRSDGLDSRTGTAVQGDLVIQDNVLETVAGGLLYAISVGGDVIVTGNTLLGGFGEEQSLGLFGYFGRTEIAGNYIEGLVPMRISEDSFGRNHPLTAAAGRTWAEGDWERASTTISNNTIVSRGLGGLDVMISKNVVLSNNDVVADRIPGLWVDGIYLWQFHDGTVQANTVSGSAIFGMDLDGSVGNVLVGNNLNQFSPQSLFGLPPSHIAFIFGAEANTVVGGGMGPGNLNYLEFAASGNLVTGYGPIAGEFNQEDGNVVAEAMRQKQVR